MSTFAPLQFLKSAQNPLVWTAVDNGTDTRTSLIIYYGAVNTLPADTGMYEVNCIMMHQAEKQLYANTGTTTTPSWEAFGPNSAFPQPLVPGSFLFTDGVTVYWATQLVGQVQYNASNLNQYGILNFNSLLVASNDVPNSRINVDLDVVSLASNTTFVNSLLANTSFISGISTALLALSSFITNLITTLLANTTFISGITNIVNTSSSTSINLGTQVTGTLQVSNMDVVGLANDGTFIAALEPNLDIGNLGGSLNLSTQTTGVLPLANGGTGASLSDPNYDAVYVWDNTTNATRLANLSGLTYDSGSNTLSTGAGFSSGFEMMFNQVTSTSPSVSVTQQVWKFSNYIFMQFGAGSDYSSWQLDSVTGSPYKVSLPFTISQTKSVSATPVMFVSNDGTKLYYAYQNNLQDSGSGYVLVVDEFNTSFVNTNTYTYTYSAPPGQLIVLGDTFFVIGTDMYIYNGVTVHIGEELSRFTISGSTLTSRTSTTGGSNFKQTVWDGTNLWTINSAGTAFGKFTVSGTTLTSVSATFKYPTVVGNPDLFSGCDIGYGIGIYNGQFGVWQPSGYSYAICTSSGPTNDYFEIVQATLRLYPKP